MNMPTLLPCTRGSVIARFFLADIVASLATTVMASPEDDARAVFDQFVNAQNAHDLIAVHELLLDSPNFLWVTCGVPVLGRDAALERFEALYQGTWKLWPEIASMRVVLLGDMTAQIYVPITFSIGPPGQPATCASFLMNQTLVKTTAG